MLNLKRVFQNYEETCSLNAMVNLFGFIGNQVFLTKSGDAGVVLEFQGVDYECLDPTAVDGLTKRLESALRLFDENYRVYQMLFKRNRQAIPHSYCGNAVVDSAIRDRIAYFGDKADTLFSISIFFVVLCPALAARRSLTNTILEFPEHPQQSIAEVRARLSSQACVRLDDREITRAESVLRQKAESFCTHVSDFVFARILPKDEAFKVLAELNDRSKHPYVSSYLIASIYAGLGDKDKAFASLERAYEDRSWYMSHLKLDPELDSLHSDPRFADLARRVGLP